MADLHSRREERDPLFFALVMSTLASTLVQVPRSYLPMDRPVVRKLAQGHDATQHAAFGEAAHIAVTLRLHEEAPYEGLDPIECEVRKRIFWLLFGYGQFHCLLNCGKCLYYPSGQIHVQFSDYVDLFLIHTPEQARKEANFSQLWEDMEKIKQEGLAKSIGVSNFMVEDLKIILETAKVLPSVNKVGAGFYSILMRSNSIHMFGKAAEPITKLCQEHGIVIASYGGLTPIVRVQDGPLNPVLASIRERLEKTRGHTVTTGQVLTKWILAKNAVVVTTTSKVSRIQEFLDVQNVPDLTAEEVKAIEAAGAKLHKRAYLRHLFGEACKREVNRALESAYIAPIFCTIAWLLLADLNYGGTSSPSTSTFDAHANAVEGGVVGGVLGLFILCGLLYGYFQWKQRLSRNRETLSSRTDTDDSALSKVEEEHSMTQVRAANGIITPGSAVPSFMGSLRRTETLVQLPETNTTSASANPANNTTALPYPTLQYYKEQQLRQNGLVNHATVESITILDHNMRPNNLVSQNGRHQRQSSTARPSSAHKVIFSTIKRVPPPKAPSQVILPSVASPITITHTHRTSSPLSPLRTVIPGRPIFPHSKPEPDLYHVAIKTHMRSSPVGQKILHMGPRLALSIIDVTKELEIFWLIRGGRGTETMMS
ncbi:Aldo/keto reductase [Phlegmacium glaucopus]|nr:Aldo/keto reductase [Phlegmacium glaucopus]